MAHQELIAELKKEIAKLEDSVAFWEKQPDLQVRGFSVTEHREMLRGHVAELTKALAILESV